MHRDTAARPRNGFTIIELLLVLVITSIVVSIAVPRVDFVSLEVSSAARQVSIQLMAAQRLAVLRQHAVVVAFDVPGRRLRVHQDRNNNGRVDEGEILNYVQLEDAAVFSRGSAPALSFGDGPVAFTKTQDGMPAVTFHRSGSAGESGGLYLTSVRDATMGVSSKDARAFEVNRATGRVSFFQFTDRWQRNF